MGSMESIPTSSRPYARFDTRDDRTKPGLCPSRYHAAAVWEWYLQKDGKVRRLSEVQLRKLLQKGRASGIELVRRADQTQWYPLHDSPMYAEEVAFEGSPQEHARWKVTRGFAIHFMSYAAVSVITGFAAPVVLFWGIGIALHGAKAFPSAKALYDAGKLPYLKPPHLQGALPPAPGQPQHIPRAATAPQPVVPGPAVGGVPVSPGVPALGPASPPTAPQGPTPQPGTGGALGYDPTIGVTGGSAPRNVQDRQLHASVRERLFGEQGQAPVQIGRYRLEQQIGAGGMGIVYRAHDESLDRTVALKLLRAEIDTDAGTERLQREARSMAKVSHPNVVTVFDVGVFEGAVFVAMEFVQGHTLRAWLDQAPAVGDVVAVLSQAGQGLAAAHDGGLVHRDFKPENAIVGDDGRVRVLDFGLAKTIDDTATQDALTRTGTVLGTPRYMTPEQFRGEPADALSDQFSFAVVVYEALYGFHPYQPPDDMPLPRSVLKGRLRATPARANVPTALRDAILKGAAHDPDERHASIQAMLDAFGPVPATSDELGTLASAIRRLLTRRPGTQAVTMLAALDSIETVLAELNAKVASLESQTNGGIAQRLERELATAKEALETAEQDADRTLLHQQISALEQRQSGLERAEELTRRLRMRRGVAETQLRQLHLDLVRAEADDAALPDLTGPLQELRFEVDAAQEVEALLASRE